MTKQYLLDTHTFIWAAISSENNRFSGHVKAELEDMGSELFVSSVSIYEIVNKYRQGKLPEYSQLAENIHEALNGLEANELPLNWGHAERAAGLDWPHRDPFDRMLAAQAQIEEMTLITCDKAFDSAPDVETLW